MSVFVLHTMFVHHRSFDTEDARTLDASWALVIELLALLPRHSGIVVADVYSVSMLVSLQGILTSSG
jgi:hypothetical protein